MPWRGPTERRPFPSLGWYLLDWIEQHLIVPDGLRKGDPYVPTPEMARFIVRKYRLRPDARPGSGTRALVYYGAQLRRPQKWGKDPLGAAEHCCEAFADVVFDGWDEHGEPVGRPWPTPWQQCAATAEDQTANTFLPIVTMLRDGPLANTPGLDVGDTRIKLPRGDGWIEPVTASAKARLGARLTFATFTESHLMTDSDGGVALAKAMKRNLAGMGGTWLEITNAYDPSEHSVAQRTAESKAPGVLVDDRPPRTTVDLDDDQALRAELAFVYGDSAVDQGGWVDLDRIMEEARDEATGEAEARRYFLNEVRVGSRDVADPLQWAAQARTDDPLLPGEAICLGFDGSRARDATTLQACRIRDGRHFDLRTWEPPANPDEPWLIDRAQVDQAVALAFDAYQVWYLFGDPNRWGEYFSLWAGRYEGRLNGKAGSRIVEFPVWADTKMDPAIERFLTDLAAGELTHDGNPTLTRHVLNAALGKGKRRPPLEDGSRAPRDHYMKIVKKKFGLLIDALVAAILAREARAKAIEDGALNPPDEQPFFAARR
jgi:hypothetical protein